MAFQLKTKESLSDGITRNVRRQIEKAIKHLDSNEKRAPRGTREKVLERIQWTRDLELEQQRSAWILGNLIRIF
jgi:hypothetical protein